MYNSLDVARYIVLESVDKGYSLTNVKLQKLLYYTQSMFLLLKEEKCFNEPIINWRHGAVVENVYNEYRRFIFTDIVDDKNYYEEVVVNNEFSFSYEKVKYKDVIKAEDKELIGRVIGMYGNVPTWELVRINKEEYPIKETALGGEIEVRLIAESRSKELI